MHNDIGFSLSRMDTNILISHLFSLLEISDRSITHRLVRFFAFFFSIMGAEHRKTGTKGFLVVDDAVSLREVINNCYYYYYGGHDRVWEMLLPCMGK